METRGRGRMEQRKKGRGNKNKGVRTEAASHKPHCFSNMSPSYNLKFFRSIQSLKLIFHSRRIGGKNRKEDGAWEKKTQRGWKIKNRFEELFAKRKLTCQACRWRWLTVLWKKTFEPLCITMVARYSRINLAQLSRRYCARCFFCISNLIALSVHFIVLIFFSSSCFS